MPDERGADPEPSPKTAGRESPRLLLGLYDLLLFLGILLASPVLVLRIATRERYRRGLPERLAWKLPRCSGSRPRIWVHAASAGEMVAAAPLVRALERRHPEHEVLLSSTTTAGVAVANRMLPERVAFVLPVDLGPLVRRVVRHVRPRVLILLELELWPNLVAAAGGAGACLCVANGRVGEASARRYAGRWIRRLVGLDQIDLFAVQTDVYRERLLAAGVRADRVVVTGNTKVDVDVAARGRRAELRAELGVRDGERVVVAGSTHPGEEALVAAACRALESEGSMLRLVVAPRHKERLAAAEAELRGAGLEPCRLSRIRRGEPLTRTVVVDTMGELAALYAAADAAVVGGSLVPGIGGHNVFEPVQAGAPTLIGPHHKNVRSDVLYLEAAGAIRICRNTGSLSEELQALFEEEGRALVAAADRALERARGAADRTLTVIEERCSS